MSLRSGEIFVPDLSLEADRLAVVEYALGDGGLIDKHLRWADVELTPSASLHSEEYGYLPPRFAHTEIDAETDIRPKREPIDFLQIATDVLGLPYDTPFPILAARINEVDNGWFEFLVTSGLLDEKQAVSMQKAAAKAYRMNALTEDNLPAYTSVILGGFMAMAARLGMKTPAIEEWSRGIWTAEEDGHKITMNLYGITVNLINDLKHVAGRTSQLRSGMEIALRHLTQLYLFVDWQEPSAGIAHGNTADLYGPVGNALQERTSKDEFKHHFVYHGIVSALYALYPEDVIRTARTVLIKPVMPGSKGVPRFVKESVLVDKGGIFGRQQAHEAGRMVLGKLDLLDPENTPEGLSDEAQKDLAELRGQYGQENLGITSKAAFVLGETLSSQELRIARRDYSQKIGLPVRAGRVV